MATGVPWSKETSIAATGRGLSPHQQLERARQYHVSEFWWVALRYLAGGPLWPFLLPPIMLLGLFAYALRRIHRGTEVGGSASPEQSASRDLQAASLMDAWDPPGMSTSLPRGPRAATHGPCIGDSEVGT